MALLQLHPTAVRVTLADSNGGTLLRSWVNVDNILSSAGSNPYCSSSDSVESDILAMQFNWGLIPTGATVDGSVFECYAKKTATQTGDSQGVYWFIMSAIYNVGGDSNVLAISSAAYLDESHNTVVALGASNDPFVFQNAMAMVLAGQFEIGFSLYADTQMDIGAEGVDIVNRPPTLNIYYTPAPSKATIVLLSNKASLQGI